MLLKRVLILCACLLLVARSASANTCASFNGSTGTITLSTAPTILGADLTMDGYVKVAGSTTGAFLSFENNAGSEGYNVGIGTGTMDSSGLNLLGLNTFQAWVVPSPNMVLSANTWTYFAVRVNTGTNVWTFNLAGTQQTVSNAGSSTTPSPIFAIGAEMGTSRFFTGNLCDVAIYPAVLSDARITAHQAASTQATYDAAVLADTPNMYYLLNDAVASGTAADDSGNSRTATVAGGVTFGISPGPFVAATPTPTATATATATATNTATPTATATCTPGPGCMTPTPAGQCTPNASIHLLNSSKKVMNGTASATTGTANWDVFGTDSGNAFIVDSYSGTASGTTGSPAATVRFVDNNGAICSGTDSAVAAASQATYRVCTSTHLVAACSAGGVGSGVLPNLSVNIIDANGFVDDTF